jgi:acyl-CoA synthetase (AMP-forming)/AMP-acid ligase II
MNIAEIIAGHAVSQPEKAAIDTGSETITYAAFDGMVRAIAAGLRRHGVSVGDVVAVRMRDTPLHVATLVAVLRVGAVVLPIDWRAAPAEIEKIVLRFTPRVVVADDEALPPVSVPVLRPSGTGSGAATPPAPLANAAMAYAMTSGTTGEPKVFRLTHEAYHARVMQFRDSGLILPTDRLLGPIPMAYAAGREMALGLMLQGATFLMLPPLHAPAEFVSAANGRGATVALVSPNITRALLAHAEGASGRLLPRLRLYINATAKAEPEERERIVVRIAPAVADMYGSTGAGLISIIHGSERGNGRTSVGRPGPGIVVEVVGDDHRPVAPGAIGRVRVRGPGVVTEFVGDVAFGDEGIRDGWYYPGDIGSFDADGFLHLHDRAADLIKRGGLMIHAQEVEHLLRTHPAILDAAVVGIPSPTLGQEVAAFVVARGAPPEAAAVITYCRERLAGYKAPSRVVFLRELPRNANGKVVKADLAKLA